MLNSSFFLLATAISMLLLVFGSIFINYEKILKSCHDDIEREQANISKSTHITSNIKIRSISCFKSIFIFLHIHIASLSKKEFVGVSLICASIFLMMIAVSGLSDLSVIVGIISVFAVFLLFSIENWKNYGVYVSVCGFEHSSRTGGRKKYTILLKNEKNTIVHIRRIWIECVVNGVKMCIELPMKSSCYTLMPYGLANIEAEYSYHVFNQYIVDYIPLYMSKIIFHDGKYEYNCSTHNLTMSSIVKHLTTDPNNASISYIVNSFDNIIYDNSVLYVVKFIVDSEIEYGFISKHGVFTALDRGYMYCANFGSYDDTLFSVYRMSENQISSHIKGLYPEISDMILHKVNSKTPNICLELDNLPEILKSFTSKSNG